MILSPRNNEPTSRYQRRKKLAFRLVTLIPCHQCRQTANANDAESTFRHILRLRPRPRANDHRYCSSFGTLVDVRLPRRVLLGPGICRPTPLDVFRLAVRLLCSAMPFLHSLAHLRSRGEVEAMPSVRRRSADDGSTGLGLVFISCRIASSLQRAVLQHRSAVFFGANGTWRCLMNTFYDGNICQAQRLKG